MIKKISIIGGGPSGLMAADVLSANRYKVTIYERKPTFGRKFLMAGRGGLNISHSEDLHNFVKKYGTKSFIFKEIIDNLLITGSKTFSFFGYVNEFINNTDLFDYIKEITNLDDEHAEKFKQLFFNIAE